MGEFEDTIKIMTEDVGGGDVGGDATGAPPADTGGAPVGGMGDMGGAEGVPEMDQTEPKLLDKPYTELADIMYRALMQDHSEIGDGKYRVIEAQHPEKITTDEQGLKLISAIDDALNETQGVEQTTF